MAECVMEFKRPNILHLSHPLVLRGASSGWGNEDFFNKLKMELRETTTAFRIGPLFSRTVREFECLHLTASFGHFFEWAEARSILEPSNPFSRIPAKTSNEVFVYADYKHFNELFEEMALPSYGRWSECVDCPLASDSLDTNSKVAFNTLWLGSRGSHSPLHYDTYGVNMVSQLAGRKRWRLWPSNSDSSSPRGSIPPLRVPFEESSVYSSLDPRYTSSSTTVPQPSMEVLLEPGDVLLVPKHWWHIVECESEVSLSINRWLPHPDDTKHRLEEAVAKFVFGSITSTLNSLGVSTTDSHSGWISPSEERQEEEEGDEDDSSGHVNHQNEENMRLLILALRDQLPSADEGSFSSSLESKIQRMLSELIHPDAMRRCAERLLE